MDILTSLMWGASLKKAALLEQWLVNHRMCDPGPHLAFSDDQLFEHGKCSCGEEIEIAVNVHVSSRVKPKAVCLA
jgi:hypothetical protein